MKRLEVLSVIGDEIVVKADKEHLYEKVFDSRNNHIGKIIKILGPVSSPYGVIKSRIKVVGIPEVYVKE
ncbi:MAG: hypothetical protein M1113_03245 [Candidatus Thermoplasmatota archaeon]|nr:hypothetical protein [Candidatus Thermoplasmatota archaeon]